MQNLCVCKCVSVLDVFTSSTLLFMFSGRVISNMQQEVELNLKVQVDLRLQEQVRKQMFEVFVQLIINHSSCESLTDRGSESQRRVPQCQIWRHTSWHRL